MSHMYSSEMRYLNLKSAKSRSIPGFRRYAMYSDRYFGMNVGDFDSRIKFGFVLYRPIGGNEQPVRVVIKTVDPERPLEQDDVTLNDLDPSLVQRLVEGLPDDVSESYTVRDGIGYFTGTYLAGHYDDGTEVVAHSFAAKFLNHHGDALATYLGGKGRISNLAEANYVNELLTDVNAFALEMEAEATPQNMGPVAWGTASYAKHFAELHYNEYLNSLQKIDDEMNQFYRELRENLAVMEAHGVTEDMVEYSE